MGHEKQVCYRLLVAVAGRTRELVEIWPRGYAYLVDQVTRAIASAVLNLAEGNGKRSSSRERRRFFQMSLGSIAEVSACIDLMGVFKLVSRSECAQLKDRLNASYCMIRKLP